MNKRIRELAKQAGGHFATHNLMSNPIQYRESIELWDKNIEKFAELIVKECMSQIEEVKNIKAGNAGPVYTQGFDDGMFVAIRTIEEHFGVE